MSSLILGIFISPQTIQVLIDGTDNQVETLPVTMDTTARDVIHCLHDKLRDAGHWSAASHSQQFYLKEVKSKDLCIHDCVVRMQ